MSEFQNNQNAPRRMVPVGACIIEAYRYVWANRGEFLRTAMLPVVGLSLLIVALGYFFPEPLIRMDENGQMVSLSFAAVLQLVAQAAFYSMFAVAWHRKWLISEEGTTIGTALGWDSRKTKFFLRGIGLFIAAFLAAIPVAFVVGIFAGGQPNILVAVPITVVMLLVLARGSLILPAAAVDDPRTITEIWRAAKGNSWRMLAISLAPQIPVTLVWQIVVSFILAILQSTGLLPSLTGTLVLNLVAQTIYFFGVAVGVSALSMAYVSLLGKVPQTPAPQASE